MRFKRALGMYLFAFFTAPTVTLAQCKNEYTGTNTGLACEVSTDGNGSITLEDDEGNSKTLNAKKAKRTLAQEENQLKKFKKQTISLLEQTRRLNSNGFVSDSKVAAAMAAVSLTAGSLLGSEAQIEGSDTIGEARGTLKSIKSETNQAIRQNNKTKRLLKNCKKSQCDCQTKTVSATMEFHYGTDPAAQNNCKAFGLAKWSAEETRNAKSVEVFYTWTGSGAPLRSKIGTPPYDDTYPFYDSEVVAGESSHQLLVTQGSRSSGNPDAIVDCSDISAGQKALVTNPYVEAEVCLVVKK